MRAAGMIFHDQAWSQANAAPVREEITPVVAELDRLGAAGEVSDESRVLFNTLLMIVDLLVSVVLESGDSQDPPELAQAIASHAQSTRARP